MRVTGVCLGAVVAAAGGCASRSRPVPSPATTVTAPATTGTTTDPSTPVLAGYRSFWDAYLRAGDPMDPTNPILDAHASGDELRQVRQTFAGHFQRGEVLRGTLDLRPRVTAQTESAATVTDCYGDSTHIYDGSSGEQKDPPATVRYQVTATLVVEGGAWKVSAMRKEGEACSPA